VPEPRSQTSKAKDRPNPARSRNVAAGGDHLPTAPVDTALLAELKSLRTALAREEKLPAYCVFSDATLNEIAARRPRTDADLLAIRGIGPQKVGKYGQRFLAILARS
jgi:ATP-dependent DNA helicase RecQ